MHLQVLLIAVKAMKSSIKPSNTLITQLEKAFTRNLKEHVMHLMSLLTPTLEFVISILLERATGWKIGVWGVSMQLEGWWRND